MAWPTAAPPIREVDPVTVGSPPNEPIEEHPANTRAATLIASAEPVLRRLKPVTLKVMGSACQLVYSMEIRVDLLR
jgi:hypothetical protein